MHIPHVDRPARFALFGVKQQDGFVYVDGEHSRHPLQLGDELQLSADAPPLFLYGMEQSSQPQTRDVEQQNAWRLQGM